MPLRRHQRQASLGEGVARLAARQERTHSFEGTFEVRLGLPRGVGHGPALPLNQVVGAVAVDAPIQDRSHVEGPGVARLGVGRRIFSLRHRVQRCQHGGLGLRLSAGRQLGGTFNQRVVETDDLRATSQSALPERLS